MAARRAKKEVKAGVQQLETMFENMVEKHGDPANRPVRSNLSLLLGLVPHLIIFIFGIIVIWTAKPSSSLFSWHPTLMVLAFAVLISEAILMFSPWSSPIMQWGVRSTKVRWHWVLQACAMVAILTGIVIITANKMINKSSHYSTWHGLIGIFLSGFVALQTSAGIVVMYPEILPFKVRPVVLKRMHAFSGMWVYFAGLGTLILGVHSSWFVANVDPNLWRVCFTCPILLGISVLVQLFRNYVWYR